MTTKLEGRDKIITIIACSIFSLLTVVTGYGTMIVFQEDVTNDDVGKVMKLPILIVLVTTCGVSSYLVIEFAKHGLVIQSNHVEGS